VLWVSKYQRVSKRSLLRDRRSTLADPCLDISPIHYPIVDRQRNKKISLWLLCDLAEITGDNAKFDKNSLGFTHFSTQYHGIFRISSMHIIQGWHEIIEHLERWERRYR
jgi:hypothetical protein